MSPGVVAFVCVEVSEGNLTSIAGKIRALLRTAHYSGFCVTPSNCEFQLWGEYAIDYEPLEAVRQLLTSRAKGLRIDATEFAETDRGFSYRTEDDDNGGGEMCKGIGNSDPNAAAASRAPPPPEQDAHDTRHAVKSAPDQEVAGEQMERDDDGLFGDVVFSYSDREAVADGVLIPLLAPSGDTRHRVTANAFHELREYHDPKREQTEQAFADYLLRELLPLVPEARRVYERNVGGGILTTDFDFRVCRYDASRTRQLWHLPNEVGGVTMMLPSDY